MRGILVLTLTLLTTLTTVASHAEDTFVEKCLSGTKVLDSKLVCQATTNASGELETFILDRGQQLYANGKRLAVTRITHLPARITDMGPMPESIRFTAKSTFGLTQATITLTCDGQTQVALASVLRWPTKTAQDLVADCQVQ